MIAVTDRQMRAQHYEHPPLSATLATMSLIPEKSLSLSPQLAATLGLEEALLYQLLGEMQLLAQCGNQTQWLDVDCNKLLALLPFWQANDIRRITTSLQDKGVLAIGSAPFGLDAGFRFSLNSSAPQPLHQTRAAPGLATKKMTRLISHNWEPATDVVAQLNQYGIPRDFIHNQVAEFVTYWAERGDPQHSWNAKFLKHTLRLWREEETRHARRSRETRITRDWQPSKDAVELLNRQAGISLNFIEDAIPEFVLYWGERGDVRSTWNSDFVRHVKTQWARFTATLENDSEPRAMGKDWQPSEDLFEVLQLANIPRDFAARQIPEFILFWRESGQAHSSWNTKFLQHVKRQWARHGAEGGTNERPQRVAESVRTRDRSIVEDLTDRSWAS
ncbi:MAG: DnaT-like ssDNA-binding domain-containing protein [Porticoccaceae bacterium]|jgi:hypothetical protein